MTAPKSLDGSLDRFVRGYRKNLEHLRHLRWLGERGELEQEIAGPPSGAYGPAVSATDCRSGHGLTGDADIEWQGDDDLGWARDDELSAWPQPDST